MEKETIIRPSLLSFDFLHLDNDRQERISLGIGKCHFDVRDGHFVHDISFGEPLRRKRRAAYKDVSFDVHLRVTNPLDKALSFASLGIREITIHAEARTLGDLPKLASLKKEYPLLKRGLALSPETKVEEIRDFLPLFSSVLVMSVVPGKGGQSFLQGSEKKISALSIYRKEKGLSYQIGVDGGIDTATGPLCLRNGADYLIAGSSYKKSQDKKKWLQERKKNASW